jgi:hypothetical protein
MHERKKEFQREVSEIKLLKRKRRKSNKTLGKVLTCKKCLEQSKAAKKLDKVVSNGIISKTPIYKNSMIKSFFKSSKPKKKINFPKLDEKVQMIYNF